MAWPRTTISSRDWHWRSANSGPGCTKIFATIAKPTIPSRGALGHGRGRTLRSSSICLPKKRRPVIKIARQSLLAERQPCTAGIETAIARTPGQKSRPAAISDRSRGVGVGQGLSFAPSSAQRRHHSGLPLQPVPKRRGRTGGLERRYPAASLREIL